MVGGLVRESHSANISTASRQPNSHCSCQFGLLTLAFVLFMLEPISQVMVGVDAGNNVEKGRSDRGVLMVFKAAVAAMSVQPTFNADT